MKSNNSSSSSSTAAAVSAPGVSADGLENASKLTNTNQQKLIESGYVAEVRLQAAMSQSGRTRNFSMAQREVVKPDASKFRFQAIRRVASQRSRMDIWSNGSTTLMQNKRGNQTKYQRVDPAGVKQQLTGEQLFLQYVAAGNYTLANTTESENRTVYVFRSTEYANKTSERMPAVENVSAYQSRFAVDEKGRIRYVDLKMEYAGPKGGTANFRLRYLLRQTGDVSVAPPRWLNEGLTQVSSNSSDSGGHGQGGGGSSSGHH